MHRPVLATLAIAVGLHAGPWGTATAQQAIIEGAPVISDADTLELGAAIIRLHGIDAPEEGQSCATPEGGAWRCDQAATDLLETLVAGTRVSCTLHDVDRYGRLVSVCEAGGVDIGGALIDAGLAWAFTEYSDLYAEREAAARRAQVGIWRGEVEPQTPSEYREDRWKRAAAASPREGCPIKGNIGSSGERIYHTPWSPYYSRTDIETSEGERWFCDEAEAILEGWRPAEQR